MIAAVTQRWRDRRATYRPTGEPISTRDYEVAELAGVGSDATAKRFVVAHHYSGSYPAARRRLGLYRGDELVGLAIFSVPPRPEVLAPFGSAPACELGRFVLLDSVPSNGESWFLARCFELLRPDFAGVVSFSDPVARFDCRGVLVVFPGHIGTIYQATNAVYRGRSRPDGKLLLPDGSVLHRRSLAKIRARDQGRRYSAGLLEAHGASPLGEDEDGDAWLARWLPALTRRVPHGGNHRYLFALDKGLRRHLGASLPYPKWSPLLHPQQQRPS